MSEIVEAVKRAIRLNIENQQMPTSNIGMVDKWEAAARAAIDAYELALIEATMNTGTAIMRKRIREGEKSRP